MSDDITITAAGVYEMDADTYHADPIPDGSLSSSGARTLLSTCPARFRWEQQNPTPPTQAMELGTAAHRLVLGVGAELVEVKAKDYKGKAAKTARDEAREAGRVPLLTHQYEQVQEMAEAIRRHELAAVLLGGPGKPEQALFWKDGPRRVWRRALLDFLPDVEPGGRMIVADYKTSASAHPDAIRRAIEQHGYHMQAAWYADGITALALAETVVFLLVVQEKEPPYLVSVVQIDQVAMDAGRHENRKAIDLYARCCRTGQWPPYVEGVEPVGLPGWAENRFLKEVTSS